MTGGLWTPAARRRLTPGPVPATAAWTLAALVAGALVAAVVVAGHWYLIVGAVIALPLFVLLHRRPLLGVLVWMATAPLVVRTDTAALRRVYWLTHRALPVIVLAVVVIGAALGVHERLRGRLSWPEIALGGYLLVTVLSILYQSSNPGAQAVYCYDRVFVPMVLYVLVRLLRPDPRELSWFVPIAVFILLTQTLIGALGWFAPEVLPGAWVNRVGTRTTGTLGNPNAFGTTVLFAGMVALHAAAALPRRGRTGTRIALTSMFLLALTIAFLSLNRASWLASILVITGLLMLYPRVIGRMSVLVVILLTAVLSSGLLQGVVDLASTRFRSEQSTESALSRLPVVMASIRMYEERPIVGWGYGNFKENKRQFEGRVGDLVVPRKDHSSHNFYLTILVEQGSLGFILYLLPALWWLLRSPPAMRRLPASGFWSQKLLIILWLVLATHVVVNNFTSVQTSFSVGIWWLTLGLIGSIIDRPPGAHAVAPAGPEMAALPAGAGGQGP